MLEDALGYTCWTMKASWACSSYTWLCVATTDIVLLESLLQPTETFSVILHAGQQAVCGRYSGGAGTLQAGAPISMSIALQNGVGLKLDTDGIIEGSRSSVE